MKTYGITFNNQTGLFEAQLGVRKIGEYKTQFEAINAYNILSSKIFNFPILNKLEEKELDVDTETVKWYDKAIGERQNDKKEDSKKETSTEEKIDQKENFKKTTIEILAENLSNNGE